MVMTEEWLLVDDLWLYCDSPSRVSDHLMTRVRSRHAGDENSVDMMKVS